MEYLLDLRILMLCMIMQVVENHALFFAIFQVLSFAIFQVRTNHQNLDEALNPPFTATPN